MTTLVEIPALGCDQRLYAPFNAQVGRKTQCIVPVADRFDGCVEHILTEAPKEFFLIGTSFGGRAAIETTLAAPKRVKALIIIGAGPGPVADHASGQRRSERVRRGELELVLKEMGDIVSHLPGPRGNETMQAFRMMGREMGAEKFAQQSDAMACREDLWPRMKEIACPVLCLWGDHDQYSPHETAHKIAASVQHGQIVVVADCGHFPTLEYPAETAHAVAGFLSISG